MDWWLFCAVFFQLGFGVLFIFCIGYQTGGSLESYWIKQLFWICIGSGAFLGFAMIDYRHLAQHYGLWIFGLSLLLLFFVLIPNIGLEINGARSWIKLLGIGTLQPSEFAKPALVLFSSWYVTRKRVNLTSKNSIFEVVMIFFAPIFLIALQPDFGSCLVFIALLFCTLFINGIKIKYVVITLLIGLVMAPIFFSYLKPHQKNRIRVFIYPMVEGVVTKYALYQAKKQGLPKKAITKLYNYLSPVAYVDIAVAYHKKKLSKKEYIKELNKLRLLRSVRQHEGYNVYQSCLAVGSGGLWGKGYLKGTQNELGFLPQKVAPTDFIFSVIAEELGFVGSIFILLIYLIILYRSFRIACVAPDRFGRVLAISIGFMFFVHLYINLGMTMGIAPVIGIPLPFMSYGGSFVVSSLICIGLLQSVYIRRSLRSQYMIDYEN